MLQFSRSANWAFNTNQIVHPRSIISTIVQVKGTGHDEFHNSRVAGAADPYVGTRHNTAVPTNLSQWGDKRTGNILQGCRAYFAGEVPGMPSTELDRANVAYYL